jgi:hypothetical protein
MYETAVDCTLTRAFPPEVGWSGVWAERDRYCGWAIKEHRDTPTVTGADSPFVTDTTLTYLVGLHASSTWRGQMTGSPKEGDK